MDNPTMNILKEVRLDISMLRDKPIESKNFKDYEGIWMIIYSPTPLSLFLSYLSSSTVTLPEFVISQPIRLIEQDNKCLITFDSLLNVAVQAMLIKSLFIKNNKCLFQL